LYKASTRNESHDFLNTCDETMKEVNETAL